eukprot:CAMPEP_0178697442 /NCGR_PEP_ID=MMETSP0699-20121125/9967_1 /TAXON_ID=265572 /ORGANISM="Extubocellulus spinifer, Strain CCMP396" /LENGTH=52 /DNA_ID=CAMNT_0020343359 /DNA_START=149 /DNA_END=304 /DNA_ORIENTATION=-
MKNTGEPMLTPNLSEIDGKIIKVKQMLEEFKGVLLTRVKVWGFLSAGVVLVE